MRIWHYQMLPYLPDLQFKGQLRELVLIMRDWKRNGKTNHLLINRVMEYSKDELVEYFTIYDNEYWRRYGKGVNEKYVKEFIDFSPVTLDRMRGNIFEGWHNTAYLRVCMANLYEKHIFAIGNSRITDEEWETLLTGYKNITHQEYII